MKSHAKLTVKFLSLTIILSCFVFGLYAQNKYENILALNYNSSKAISTRKIKNNEDTKLASSENLDIKEKERQIENWMYDLSLKSSISKNHRQLEEWMYDEYFWEVVKKFEWEEEPIEEHREIEEWMSTFKIKRHGCVDIYSDFKEKEWMKKHSFFIL